MHSIRKHKLIFELPTSIKENKFKEVLNSAIKLTYSMNQPVTYRNSLCVERNQFIHNYKDGRTYLIEQDQENSEERVLKVLS
jgi:hypothetical protein